MFALSYGLTAGGWSATYTRCSTEIQNDTKSMELGILLSLFGAARGIGLVISGPLSESLLNYSLSFSELEGAYGTSYGILIVFTGVTAMFGCLGSLLRLRNPGK